MQIHFVNATLANVSSTDYNRLQKSFKGETYVKLNNCGARVKVEFHENIKVCRWKCRFASRSTTINEDATAKGCIQFSQYQTQPSFQH